IPSRLLLAVYLLVLLPLAVVAGSSAAQESSETEVRTPVVLELFTSQGCSSCPPADALLREVGVEPDVIAISYHVDYWNRLGWEDPYSAPAWSQHQEEYVRALRGDTLYTPQIVVDGMRDLVGSDRRRLQEALRERRLVGKRVQPRVDVDWGAGEVQVDIASAAGLPRGLDLRVLITESAIDTKVSRGENARRHLRHDHVARSLETIADWQGEEASLRLPLGDDWQRDHLAVVVLVQQSKGRRIVGASRIPAVEARTRKTRR
ncbi:MAG: DUF1223 domain-containing protein, partial [Acidobacteriota bacterium]